MKTDRKLLELAAKAAGWVSWDWLGGDDVLNVYDADGRHDNFAPHTDDGEALRLAVAMYFDVSVDRHEGRVYVTHTGAPWAEGVPLGDDPNAATRRAIVLAAAAIGEGI